MVDEEEEVGEVMVEGKGQRTASRRHKKTPMSGNKNTDEEEEGAQHEEVQAEGHKKNPKMIEK